MQLTPSQTFTIVRQIDNVNDATLYYIRAVVRNANTDAVLATINLASKGSQRYTAQYQIPADTSGQGTYISIITYVYDDSAYSVPDQNYATEEHTYLVIQPPLSTFGNGGTTVVDYDKIKKYIDNIKFPGIPSYDGHFKALQKYNDERFGEVREHVNKTIAKIPKPESYNDSEMRRHVSLLQDEMRSMRFAHEKAIGEMSARHEQAISDLKAHHEQVSKLVSASVGKIADRPYAAEQERDKISGEYQKLHREHQSVLGVIKTIQGTGAFEQPDEKKDGMDKRVKKLLGYA